MPCVAHLPFWEGKIIGYKGQPGLALHGTEEDIRMNGVLLSFARYAGLGIKTALGMGACDCKLK